MTSSDVKYLYNYVRTCIAIFFLYFYFIHLGFVSSTRSSNASSRCDAFKVGVAARRAPPLRSRWRPIPPWIEGLISWFPHRGR